ncbi:MAG: DNA cytosine methyltransferase [Azoarcus sp.]|nr:DNA cytosine methyltransferase [Azoarcus sp.]
MNASGPEATRYEPDHAGVRAGTRFKEWPDADVDIFVGGSPCQSFSVAGLRKGLDDPRGHLTLTYLAVVGRYRPRWVVWECVVQYERDAAECGAAHAFWGKKGYQAYMASAGDYLAKCIRQCDGK